VSNSGLGATGNVAGSGAGAPTSIVTGATTLTLTGQDALKTGTTFTGTTNIGVNGGVMKTGVTSADQNDKLELLLTNTSYHAGYFPNEAVPQGKLTFIKQYSLYKNASVTVSLFNSNNVAMDDVLVNQTVTTGSNPSMMIKLEGTDKASTNAMRCILEANDSTKVNKLELSGLGATLKSVGKPSFYTLAGTSSAIWIYDIDAIVGSDPVSGYVKATSVTGQDMSASYFKVTCYSKEYFIDSLTGKVAEDIIDSDGSTARYLSTFTDTGYFT
jgi:hypothetical protein